MSNELRLGSEKRLRIFSGRGYPELAEEVANELGVTITPTSAYDFANG
ncbi:MAG: ribose-phosphate diphosphokinase, partial [Actinomycetota bacterium]